jgi:hypothetical protein
MGKNQDLGSGINIPDPQHWYEEIIGSFPVKLYRLQHCGGNENVFFPLV